MEVKWWGVFTFLPSVVPTPFYQGWVNLHGLWWHKIPLRSFLQILVQIMTSISSLIALHFKNDFSKIIPLTDFQEDVPVSCSFIYFTEPVTHTWGHLYPRVSGTAFKRFVSLLSFRVNSKESYVSLSNPESLSPSSFLLAKSFCSCEEKNCTMAAHPNSHCFSTRTPDLFNGLTVPEVDVYLLSRLPLATLDN